MSVSTSSKTSWRKGRPSPRGALGKSKIASRRVILEETLYAESGNLGVNGKVVCVQLLIVNVFPGLLVSNILAWLWGCSRRCVNRHNAGNLLMLYPRAGWNWAWAIKDGASVKHTVIPSVSVYLLHKTATCFGYMASNYQTARIKWKYRQSHGFWSHNLTDIVI